MAVRGGHGWRRRGGAVAKDRAALGESGHLEMWTRGVRVATGRGGAGEALPAPAPIPENQSPPRPR